ncbi:MAG TPA: DNA/RNA helicase domain-containing protein [Microbacteriaceae bacterium]|nr:DNA/RNA helicase domain-containing protein [Microbacteriaceae bacterium]
MTASRVERLAFDEAALRVFSAMDARHQNWPVVYLLDGGADVYVGETLDATARIRQHLANPSKRNFEGVRVVLDETFNKSVCLDLEAFLINALKGDGRLVVRNLNAGIVDRDYYERERYRATFLDVFEQLRSEGVFERRIEEIENSDLFKLSPFKALQTEQAVAIEGILEGLFEDLERGTGGTIVVQGDPGTGKTIVGITLMKVLQDIQSADRDDLLDADAMFSDFFVPGYAEQIEGMRIGLVVPQQSLRASIKKAFRTTPGLSADMVLSPFEVGASSEPYDILIVDEAHRLSRRANQSSGMRNRQFREITESLFGWDDIERTQLDWIRASSTHQVLLIDPSQRVKPADLDPATLDEVLRTARREGRHYALWSQMRVFGGNDYIEYVRSVLAGTQRAPLRFQGYELKMFDDLGALHDAIRQRDEIYGLARLVAGYAWPWQSKRDASAYDIELDGRRLRWNRTETDWIGSPTAIDEVGSIHTVQGYDLNYAGVVIGPDLRFDPIARRIYIDRASYFDTKGKENNPTLGISFSDDDLLEFIRGVYFVLLTRGIRGTYVYAVDPELRAYLKQYLPSA